MSASIALGCVTALPPDARAQVYNQTCQSAEYARTLNRNAAADATDIVVYNPASLVDLSEGFHINLSNQTWFRRPSHSFDDPLGKGRLSFEQEATDWVVPNVHTAYRRSDWAVFASAYIPGGGASVKYPDGSYSTRSLGAGVIGPGGPLELIYDDIRDEYLEGTSLYLALSAGYAVRVSDVVSIAAGIRTLSVANEIKGGLTLSGGLLGPLTQDVPLRVHARQTGRGWGIVAGIQATPVESIRLAAHYESPIRLDLKNHVYSDDNVSDQATLFTDGGETPLDFPAMVGLGASYSMRDDLRIEIDFNYWFQENADWGTSGEGRGISRMAGDSFSAGAAVAYRMTPRLELSTGLLYTWYAFEDKDGFYSNTLGAIEVFYEDDLMAGLGFGWEIHPGIKFNAGSGFIVYRKATIHTPAGPVRIENDLSSAVAVGVDWSF